MRDLTAGTPQVVMDGPAPAGPFPFGPVSPTVRPTDPAGVTAARAGALERVQLLLADWQHTTQRLTDVETRMTGVLDELGLTRLATSIPGLSAVGAAAILAQTGDPRRYASAPSLVKHAGFAPRQKLSGAFVGRTKLTGQGGPGLRLAAWRAVWAARLSNPVMPPPYRHLTTREHNELRPNQAQTVLAAAIAKVRRSAPGPRPRARRQRPRPHTGTRSRPARARG